MARWSTIWMESEGERRAGFLLLAAVIADDLEIGPGQVLVVSLSNRGNAIVLQPLFRQLPLVFAIGLGDHFLEDISGHGALLPDDWGEPRIFQWLPGR